MRAPWMIAALLAAPAAAAQEHHGGGTYHFARVEADYAPGPKIASWDAEAWVGGDRDRLWLKSEGDLEHGDAERAEAQALWSRNVWTFFDAQLGVRHDFAREATTWAALGVQGLAPYLLETELHAFVSTRGDVQLRAKQSFDLLLTNRLILEPLAEIEVELADSARREVESGFSRFEGGVQLRYEVTQKFAPYAALVHERLLGGTARLARASGEDVGGWRVGLGLRVGF